MTPARVGSDVLVSCDGLTVRNESWESRAVVASLAGDARERSYYEVAVLSSGPMQLGWATADALACMENGAELGMALGTVAVDGCRGVVVASVGDASDLVTAEIGRTFDVGDIVGLELDAARGVARW
jgi:hypothetical protein